MTQPIVSPRPSAPEGARAARGRVLRRAASREDWAAVRALRFASLTREGDIAPCALPTYGDAHDGAPGTSTFLLVERGRAIGATRSSLARADGAPRLPAMAAFGREIAAKLACASVAEASLTVVDPGVDRATALLALFKAHMLVCAAADVEWLVAAVRETEMGFYRRVFDMEILTGAANVPGLAKPRVLMGIAYRERAAHLFQRLPLLAASGADFWRFAAGAELGFDEEDGARPEPRARASAGDSCA